MKIFISISHHARERFLMRGGLDEIIKERALQAFNNGKNLTEEEFLRMFDKEVIKSIQGDLRGRFFEKKFKKYGKLVYIFGGRTETEDEQRYKLITVLPI